MASATSSAPPRSPAPVPLAVGNQQPAAGNQLPMTSVQVFKGALDAEKKEALSCSSSSSSSNVSSWPVRILCNWIQKSQGFPNLDTWPVVAIGQILRCGFQAVNELVKVTALSICAHVQDLAIDTAQLFLQL